MSEKRFNCKKNRDIENDRKKANGDHERDE